MGKCKNCGTPITKEWCEEGYPEGCEHWTPKKPKTDADLVRAMTDEELYDLFREIYNAGIEDAVAYEWGKLANSFKWTMEWLQQPVEGE